MAILETKNLTKRFDGVRALDTLSVGIERGAITGVIGPNGSGKSTLVNVLTGLLPADSGAVSIDSVRLAKIVPADMPTYGITRTFQEVRLFGQMSVLDNLLVVMTERNVFSALFERHRAWHVEKAEEILDAVGLAEKRDERVEHLSYGQRKLLEIGRALAMDAEILLLDEPFSGLSPRMVKVVKALLTRLQREGKTILLIEHNIDLIRELSNRVVVLDSGALLAEGKPETVLAMPSVIAAYLGK